jgi:membrane protease YdiL (CAAX protease family)
MARPPVARTVTPVPPVLEEIPMTAPSVPAAPDRTRVAAPAAADRRSLAWFVVLALGLAVAGTLLTIASPTMASVVPFLLALGPAVIAFGLAAAEGSAKALARTMWRRPSARRWYLVLGLPVVWALGTVAIGTALGQTPGDLFPELFPAVLIVPLVVLVPGFAEEVAWRGFAVPRLAATVSPLATAVLLAVPWVVLHLVLHLPGGVNAGAEIWPTVVSLVAYSVLLTWIVLRTGGSILLAGLVHTGFNGVVPLMRGVDLDAAWAIRAVLIAAIAIVVVVLGGLRTRPA